MCVCVCVCVCVCFNVYIIHTKTLLPYVWSWYVVDVVYIIYGIYHVYTFMSCHMYIHHTVSYIIWVLIKLREWVLIKLNYQKGSVSPVWYSILAASCIIIIVCMLINIHSPLRKCAQIQYHYQAPLSSSFSLNTVKKTYIH